MDTPSNVTGKRPVLDPPACRRCSRCHHPVPGTWLPMIDWLRAYDCARSWQYRVESESYRQAHYLMSHQREDGR